MRAGAEGVGARCVEKPLGVDVGVTVRVPPPDVGVRDGVEESVEVGVDEGEELCVVLVLDPVDVEDGEDDGTDGDETALKVSESEGAELAAAGWKDGGVDEACADDGVGVGDTMIVFVVRMEFVVPLAMLEGTASVEVSLGMGEAKEPCMSANLQRKRRQV